MCRLQYVVIVIAVHTLVFFFVLGAKATSVSQIADFEVRIKQKGSNEETAYYSPGKVVASRGLLGGDGDGDGDGGGTPAPTPTPTPATFGRSCTCDDGQVYLVGGTTGDCESSESTCDGGSPGGCYSVTQSIWSSRTVVCQKYIPLDSTFYLTTITNQCLSNGSANVVLPKGFFSMNSSIVIPPLCTVTINGNNGTSLSGLNKTQHFYLADSKSPSAGSSLTLTSLQLFGGNAAYGVMHKG